MKKMIAMTIGLFLVCFQNGWADTPEALSVKVKNADHRVSAQRIDNAKLLVSVTDEMENAVQGLTVDDFEIRENSRKTRVTRVEPLTTSKDVGLNIVLVVDNSASMKQRRAVEPLLDAVEALYAIVRPIDTLAVVVFDDSKVTPVNGRKLNARIIQSKRVADIRTQVADALNRRLTDGTYLNDAMLVGLDVVSNWPERSNKFMVVFSDGEDLNSTVADAEVLAATRDISNFSAYTIDYMPTETLDPFMQAFAAKNSGYARKAGAADELVPIFREFSSTLLHRYVVSYRFLSAPSVDIAVAPAEVAVEEMTTIDSAPLLNYVFFETGESELAAKYRRLDSRAATDAFSEAVLTSVMEKYAHLVNIVGSRMRRHPQAAITLVGCNANTGVEAGRMDLSRSRAESVRAYLHYVWGIETERMAIEARNLPDSPSTNRIPEGQAENRRVEIRSAAMEILEPVKSEYAEKISRVRQIEIAPAISAEAGVDSWEIVMSCGDAVIGRFSGAGEPAPRYALPVENEVIDKMVAAGKIDVSCRVTDREANTAAVDHAAALPVRFIQRQQQQAQNLGHKIREKYALILFDYDSDAIQSRNKTIVDHIVDRMQALPEAGVVIEGHTDNIGKEAYNQDLSERRAKAVMQQIREARETTAPESLAAHGSGPHQPLYDNATPEGRALNRTVTIALEYEEN